MKNVITSTPGSKVTNQLEQSGVPIARHQSRSQRSSTTGLTFSRPLQILMMVLVLLLLATSAVSSLSTERINDGGYDVYILWGKDLPVEPLFAFERPVFEEIIALLQEEELLEEDYAALGTSFEKCVSQIDTERKVAKAAIKQRDNAILFWKTLAFAGVISAVAIGLSK